MERKAKLLGRMRELGLRQRDVAREIGVCPTTIHRKLTGKSAFRDREIAALVSLLGIQDSEISEYFFVPEKLHNENSEMIAF